MARLFISFYLFIAVSLVGLAALLNSIFFDDNDSHQQDQQALISVLAALNQQDSRHLLHGVNTLQWPTEYMARSELALPPQQAVQLQQQGFLLLHDAQSRRYVYFVLPEQQLLRLELPEVKNESSLWLYSSVFFLVLGALIAMWLWPLWRDLTALKVAAASLQDDGSLAVANVRAGSMVASIANAFNRLGQQVKGLLQTQRELAGAVAHELRTPLSRMKFALVNPPDEQRWHDLQHDVQELERLVQEMLDYASMETTTPELNFGEIPLQDLLQQIQHKLLVPPNKTLTLCETSIVLNGDGHFIERALLNVISNALRYAQSSVQVSVVQQNDAIHIVCDDDGPGVPDAERERIFEAFYRPDSSRDRRRGGAGLGLAIVKRILQWHDGNCWVESSPLGGARFVLQFPH